MCNLQHPFSPLPYALDDIITHSVKNTDAGYPNSRLLYILQEMLLDALLCTNQSVFVFWGSPKRLSSDVIGVSRDLERKLCRTARVFPVVSFGFLNTQQAMAEFVGRFLFDAASALVLLAVALGGEIHLRVGAVRKSLSQAHIFQDTCLFGARQPAMNAV